jgi:mannose-6-phosphate isomerase-like protein (cupin superfamily)
MTFYMLHMKGYVGDIEKITLENTFFRQALYTDVNCQLVVMSLLPHEEIGEEIHDVDQFLRIEAGQGKAILDDEERELNDGSVVIVPAGVKHNIMNTGETSMKLHTLYMPPHHRDGIIHKTKAEAEADE